MSFLSNPKTENILNNINRELNIYPRMKKIPKNWEFEKYSKQYNFEYKEKLPIIII